MMIFGVCFVLYLTSMLTPNSTLQCNTMRCMAVAYLSLFVGFWLFSFRCWSMTCMTCWRFTRTNLLIENLLSGRFMRKFDYWETDASCGLYFRTHTRTKNSKLYYPKIFFVHTWHVNCKLFNVYCQAEYLNCNSLL